MRILIINPFGIGDVLFTTPVIRAIKNAYPQAFIGYWCNERVVPVLKNSPNINKIFALSRGDWKKIWKRNKIEAIRRGWDLRKEILNEKFEISIDFSLDHRYGLMARSFGIKRRIGINYKNRGKFLTEKIDIDWYKDKHVVEYYLDTLNFLDIPRPQNPRLEVFLSPEERQWADGFLKENRFEEKDVIIGVSPGGGESWGENAVYKHWPSEKFKNLIELVIKNFNSKVIIFGSENEKNICNQIVAAFASERVINTAGKITLSQFMALVERCKLLVCNDGGPIHVATALGVKTVSLFGPVDEKVYGPYPPEGNYIVIKKDLPCRPCYRNFRFPGCDNNHRCLRDITVKEVYSTVKKFLITL